MVIAIFGKQWSLFHTKEEGKGWGGTGEVCLTDGWTTCDFTSFLNGISVKTMKGYNERLGTM